MTPDELRERLAGRRVVASVSGGKDSAAMSLHLRELGIEHDRVFADTGWEADETIAYVRDVLPRVIGPIAWVRADRQMEEICLDKAMFPSKRRRWCTELLKVVPIREFMRGLGEDARIVSVVGIRAEESEARARYPEWEPHPPGMSGLDVETWRPLLAWPFADVVAIHKRHGLAPNPLYLWGAERVGCWPCVYARKSEIELIARRDPERIRRLRVLEQRVGALAAERYEPIMGAPAWFQSQKEDADGRYPMVPIDDVVEWARTARGGVQFELFAPPEDDGCMRWGLCETATPNRTDTESRSVEAPLSTGSERATAENAVGSHVEPL